MQRMYKNIQIIGYNHEQEGPKRRFSVLMKQNNETKIILYQNNRTEKHGEREKHLMIR